MNSFLTKNKTTTTPRLICFVVPPLTESVAANLTCLQTEGDTAANKEAVAEFESAIRSAVTPVVKTSSQQPGATSAAAASKETEAAPPPPAARDTASKTVTVKEAEKEKEKEGRETEISKAYQIFPDEVLGSGQFGIVYGGVHR